MPRILLAGIVMLSAVGILVPTALRAEEAKELNIIAAAYDSPRETGIGPVVLGDEGGVVIRGIQDLVAMSGQPGAERDAAAQKELETELAKVLDVASIDWSKQMVLAVRGKLGTRLDRIHIDSLKVEGKVLTVAWKVKQRPPHAGPGNPVSLILVDRFDDEVKFVELGR